jgi:uncharacterized damage-inducible protein DinB
MITPDYARLMARYNRWQNESLYGAARALSDAQRRQERGAFFGSIHATLSHLLWGDGAWMSRFSGSEKPPGGISGSGALYGDWDDLCARRRTMDAQIARWADGLDPAWLAGDLTWFSGAAGREIRKPAGFLVAHFFNHQTHHRGQVHAMLTAAGAKPGDTDLFYLE